VLLSLLFAKVQAFNLIDAYQSALSYNAEYLKAIAQNQAGQENVVQGRAQLLPQLSATGAMNENYLNTSGMAMYYHQPTASAQLQQVVFDFNKFSQYTKSKYATELANLQFENARQQLILNVAQAYFDVLYATDTLNAITMTKSALLAQEKQAKQAFDVGTVTIADFNDAQSAYDSAVAQEIQAENDLINKKNIFRNLTGLDPDTIQPLVDKINLVSPKPGNAEDWANLAKVGNMNIKIANKQVEMSEQDIKIAKAGHLPSISAVGSYQYQGVSNVDSANAVAQSIISQSSDVPGSPLSAYSSAAVGLQINIPLYSGGGISSQVRQAISNYEASRQQLTSVKRQTDQSIKNAYWQVENGVSMVKAQAQALKSAQVKLNSDKMGYQVGIRNSVDLVNSQRNYFQTLQSYNNSRYQYLNYRLQLKYLSGQLDQDFLKAINLDVKS
jgi:outer membrane protein